MFPARVGKDNLTGLSCYSPRIGCAPTAGYSGAAVQTTKHAKHTKNGWVPGERLVTGSVSASPAQATPRPYTRHILGIDSGVQSHHKATTKPPTRQEKATPRLHQGSTKATPRLHQSQEHRGCARIRFVFSSYSLRILLVFRSCSPVVPSATSRRLRRACGWL